VLKNFIPVDPVKPKIQNLILERIYMINRIRVALQIPPIVSIVPKARYR
jgi:hypothetical protein